MADKKQTSKGSESKIKDLKIELLKNPTKKKGIKKEIARLLTAMNSQSGDTEGPAPKGVPLPKRDEGKTQTKLEGKK